MGEDWVGSGSGTCRQARRLTEQALQPEHNGDQDTAGRVFGEADRIDPLAALDVSAGKRRRTARLTTETVLLAWQHADAAGASQACLCPSTLAGDQQGLTLPPVAAPCPDNWPARSR